MFNRKPPKDRNDIGINAELSQDELRDVDEAVGKIKKLGVVVAVVLIALILITNIYSVKPSEYAIIKQFGKVVRVVDQEGPIIKVPFIQTLSIMPKATLFYDVTPTEINTLDKKRIVVDYYVLWKINDPIKVIETLRTIEGTETRLSDIMYSNIRNELGKLAYGDIINIEQNSRGNADQQVVNLINQILINNDNGIEVVDIKMKRVDLPIDNEGAVYNRMISERASKAQEYLSQGDSEKARIEAEVDREVAELIAKTNTKAQEIIAAGEKEAAEIYNNAYGKDPDFFKLYTTLESYKITIGDQTVIMLPSNSEYVKYITGK